MVQIEYAIIRNGAASWSQSRHFVPKSTAQRRFFQIFRKGVMLPSKISHAHSTSNSECTCQKPEQNTHKLFCTKPQIFPNSGAPISGLGADIRMLSLPNARGSCVLKIRSDARFLYEHSKTVSGDSEVVASFSQKRRSYLGGCGPAPSAHSIQHGGALQIDVISLRNSM